MRLFAALLAAAGLNASAAFATESEVVTRLYPVERAIREITAPNNDPEKQTIDMQKFFEDTGVSFQPGTSIRYNPLISQLIVRHTPSYHEVIEKILKALNLVANQVEIDVSFVAFENKLIEEVARKSDRAAPSVGEIKALWRGGKGRLLATGKNVTRSGVNAQIKGVREIIYPTGFTSSPGSNLVANPVGLVPGAFATRETGLIVNVTPTVAANGYTIDLTLVPELCEEGPWGSVDVGRTEPGNKTTEIHIGQPRFHSRNVTTSVVLFDGQTVVTGGLPNMEGTESTYLFISARLLDPAGRPIHDDPPAATANPAKPTVGP